MVSQILPCALLGSAHADLEMCMEQLLVLVCGSRDCCMASLFPGLNGFLFVCLSQSNLWENVAKTSKDRSGVNETNASLTLEKE
ncbi:unnamed protein product [Camellia sinensis]